MSSRPELKNEPLFPVGYFQLKPSVGFIKSLQDNALPFKKTPKTKRDS